LANAVTESARSRVSVRAISRAGNFIGTSLFLVGIALQKQAV
jgi:hypothetical protein